MADSLLNRRLRARKPPKKKPPVAAAAGVPVVGPVDVIKERPIKRLVAGVKAARRRRRKRLSK